MKSFTRFQLIALSALIMLSVTSCGLTPSSIEKEPVQPSVQAVLSLSPAEATVTIGQTQTVNVMLDTDGAMVSAVDVVIDYNPAILEVTEVKAGTLFEIYPLSKADNGTVQISGASVQNFYSGTDVFATLTVKGLVEDPEALLTLEYAAGSTTDCDVMEATSAKDILSSVGNATITLTK